MDRLTPEGCATILAKAEFMNPGGSIKDRIAKFIVNEAEKQGLLKPESRIVEVTSGNTGIAFSMVGAVKGYRVQIMLPATVSVERRSMIESFGAELELLEGLLKIQSARARCEEMAAEDPLIFLPRQFANEMNPKAHETTTGPEILKDAGDDIDAFVMGVGTGGTVMGVGKALRRANPKVQIIAVEPAESAVMSGGEPGCHGIQGLADGFIPEIVQLDQLDRVITVPTADAIAMSHEICRAHGYLVGISAGANMVAARQVARELGPGKKVVTVLCDRGERYLSVRASMCA